METGLLLVFLCELTMVLKQLLSKIMLIYILRMGKFNISVFFNTTNLPLPKLRFLLIFHHMKKTSHPLAFLVLSTTGVALAIP